ncbi:MAG: hypothetical protein PUC63_08090 [Clostridiales bacterium]|nr:hypothetical protein [Clostridiales bacterium]
MKRIFAVLLAFSLAAVICVPAVSAATDGFDFLSTAKNCSFNTTLQGECVVIITGNDYITSANLKWAIAVVLDHSDGNKYTVSAVNVGNGTEPSITLTEGQIVLGVHSSTSDTSLASEYQNVYGKNAAAALEPGDTVSFVGFDFDTLTMADGAMIVAGSVDDIEISEEPAVSDPVDVSSDEPSEESVVSGDAVSDTEAVSDSVVSDIGSSADESADVEDADNSVWLYVGIGAAIVAVALILALTFKKKK